MSQTRSSKSSAPMSRRLLALGAMCTLAACSQPVGVGGAAIVGGTTGGDPAVVWIYNTGSGGLCTGTIIEPRVVLTAKHCVQEPGREGPNAPSQIYVGLGDRAGRGTTLRTQSVYTTPGVWTEGGRGLSGALVGRDVAVLVLQTGATGITPIPIRREPPTGLAGQTITAIGFGQIPSGSSGQKYTAMGRVTSVSGDLIYVGALTCQGDSGGPMVTAEGEVAGVVSFGSGGCGSGYGAYNALHNYFDIIDMAIEEGGGCVNDGEEICDGRDNDCNGMVDETCTPIGMACASDDECVGNTCRDTAAGRICTVTCDARRPYLGCDEGFHCSRTEPAACDGWCVPTSASAELGIGETCASDDECASRFCIDPGDGRVRCLQPCAQDSGSCLAGDVCVAAVGTCGGCVAAERVAGIPHGLGEPCTDGAECASATCIEDAGARYCSRSCGPSDVCPGGYHCRDEQCVRGMLGGLGESCVSTEDCVSGAFCATRGAQAWCTQVCSEGSPCPTGFDCVSVGEGSICAPAEGLVGDACMTEADCISGVCAEGGAGLICTRECGVDSPCGPGFECRLDGAGEPLCVRPRVATSSGGGCSVARAPTPLSNSVMLALALLALGLVGRRMRRR